MAQEHGWEEEPQRTRPCEPARETREQLSAETRRRKKPAKAQSGAAGRDGTPGESRHGRGRGQQDPEVSRPLPTPGRARGPHVSAPRTACRCGTRSVAHTGLGSLTLTAGPPRGPGRSGAELPAGAGCPQSRGRGPASTSARSHGNRIPTSILVSFLPIFFSESFSPSDGRYYIIDVKLKILVFFPLQN